MVATATPQTDAFRQALDHLLHERAEPEALSSLRRQALDHFEERGLPTTRQEQWRFTDVSPLVGMDFRRAPDTPVDAAELPPAVAERSNRLVFINGRFAPGLSQLGSFPDQALVASLGHALLTHPELVVRCLGRLPGLEDQPFAALNTALWEDGAFIYLPRATVVEAPIHLVFLAVGEDAACYPRNLIVLEEAAQATVVEDFCGKGRTLSCPLTEIHLGPAALLDYHKVQEEAPEAWHLGVLRVRQARDSQLTGHLFTGGGRLARTDLFNVLDGEGAGCDLRGLNLVDNGQLGDYHVRIDHARPHGASQQLFKGVLDGKSQVVFDGMIHVHKNAQQTAAAQNNRNLLLSRQGVANSNPRLEILADDVKCSHGSTVGFLDPDHLFYLRTRGIGESQARAMLVYAFANESMEDIRLQLLRERLENLLVGRLYPEALKRQAT